MERLTERLSNGQAAVYGCGNNCKYDFKYCTDPRENCPTINEIYEKLATYEDLEDRLHKEFKGCIGMERIIDAFIEFYKQNDTDEELAEALLITNDSVRNYKEWKNLDEQGLLLKLPCKVGDTLYQPVYSSITKVGGIDEMEVLEVSDSRIWAGCDCFDYDDIGKTVFLTQAEAEEALKRMEEQDNDT